MNISLNYKPRDWQKIVHASSAQFKVAVVHRRGGKSVMAVMECLMAGLKSLANPDLHSPKILYVAPTHGMAKQIAWDELKKATREWPESKTVKKNYQNTDLVFTYGTENNNFTINLKGAEKPDNLRGMGTLYIVLDEYQDMKADTWTKVLYPTTLDYPEARVMFIGTPKGKNKLFQIFTEAGDKKRWESFYFPVDTTGIFPWDADLPHSEDWYDAHPEQIKPVTIEDIKKETTDDFGPEAYEQEFMCSWEPRIRGSIFGDYVQQIKESGRYMPVPVDNRVAVNTAWDLGRSDQMVCIYFQQVGNEIRIVNFECERGSTLKDFISKLWEFRDKHGIVYGYHLAPHDIAVKSLETGQSRLDFCAGHGLYFNLVQRCAKKADSIDAARRVFPRLWISSDEEANTSFLIEALQMYSYKYNEKTDNYSSEPDHNKYSDPADALQCLASGLQDAHGGDIQIMNASWTGDGL